MTSSTASAALVLLVGAACTGTPHDADLDLTTSRPTTDERSTDGVRAPIAPPSAGLAKVAFLVGCWVDEDPEQGVTVEETWSAALGGTMLGVGRTVVDGRTAHYEFLVLEERGDEIVYLAEPKGGVTTPFSLSTSGTDLAVFIAVYDEFPQRIIYRRQGDRLTSRLEGVRNGQKVVAEWTYRRRG